MILQLKEIKSFKSSLESVDEHFNGRFAEIKEISKLLDITRLSDNELEKLVSKFYEMELTSQEEIDLAAARLGTTNLTIKRLKTTAQVDDGENKTKVDAVVYSDSATDISENHVYSEAELTSLIQGGVIVVSYFEGLFQGLEYNQELTRFSPIIGISLQSLGIFREQVLKMVRDALQPEVVARDSQIMADKARRELNNYREFIDGQRSAFALKYHDAKKQVETCDILGVQLDFMGYGELGTKIMEEIYPSLEDEYGVTPSSR